MLSKTTYNVTRDNPDCLQRFPFLLEKSLILMLKETVVIDVRKAGFPSKRGPNAMLRFIECLIRLFYPVSRGAESRKGCVCGFVKR